MKSHSKFLQNQHEEAVNLTPLIDVLFVLLAVFIIALPLVHLDSVSLASSNFIKKNMKQVKASEQTIIHAYKNNTFSVNGTVCTEKNITETLILTYSKNRLPPLLIHDKDASFGTYHTLKTAVEKAGYDSLDIAISP